MKMEKIILEIVNERKRQLQNLGEDAPKFEAMNTPNDFIAYINAYIGRAAQKCFRNDREGCNFRENMIKAGALIIAAIESWDKNIKEI